MDYSLLTAISPIDGRYRSKTEELASYFSEFALIKYRVRIEVEYFIALCEIPLPQLKDINKSIYPKLREIYTTFSIADAEQVKNIEKTTNHDVKAVEYFLKEKFDALNLKEQKEFIHFGLTSQDINNTAIPLSVKEALSEIYFPLLDKIISKLKERATEFAEVTMLARTHGQAASPTRLGKEFDLKIKLAETENNIVEYPG